MRPITTFALLFALACNGQAADKSGKSQGGTAKKPVAAASSEEDVGEVLARVGDVVVGSKEFEAVAMRRAPADGEALSLEEKQEILDDLVSQKVLFLEARAKGLDRDPKVQKLMIQTLMRQEVYSSVRNSDFSEDELRKYFEAHQDEFVVPEKVQVKRIFIRNSPDAGKAKELADDIHAKLQSDPSQFKRLAAEHSQDPYRKRGGDLGFVAKTGKPGVPPEVTDKAFAIPMNTVSEVFESSDGYNIIMVTQKRERVERTFEQMKGSVLRKVKNDKFKTLYDDYVSGVRDGYTVETYDDKLGALQVDPPRRLELGPPGFRGGPDGVPDLDGDGQVGGH